MKSAGLLPLYTAVAAMLMLSCGGKSSRSVLTAREQFDLGIAQYEAGKYYRAIENLQAVVFNYPGESLVDTAQYYLALSYVGQKDYVLAEVEFNRLLVNYPSSAFSTESQFMKAVSVYEATPDHAGLDQSNLAPAIKQFEEFLIDHPESELLGEAQRYLALARERQAQKLFQSGIVYVRINTPKSARIYFQQVVDDHTDSRFAQLALFELAEIDFRAGAYDTARTKFDGYVTAFPQGEKVERARRRAAECAYRFALAALQAADTLAARERFESFKASYPEDSRVRKADNYLRKFGPVDTARAESSER